MLKHFINLTLEGLNLKQNLEVHACLAGIKMSNRSDMRYKIGVSN